MQHSATPEKKAKTRNLIHIEKVFKCLKFNEPINSKQIEKKLKISKSCIQENLNALRSQQRAEVVDRVRGFFMWVRK